MKGGDLKDERVKRNLGAGEGVHIAGNGMAGTLPVCAREHHQALHPHRRHPDTGHPVPGGGAAVGAGECGCLRAGGLDAVGDSGGGEHRAGVCAGGGSNLPQSADQAARQGRSAEKRI